MFAFRALLSFAVALSAAAQTVKLGELISYTAFLEPYRKGI